MITPEISVVTSVFNGGRYLRKSLESILVQEGVDLEFIIVNDGSTDNTVEILAEYAAHDSRIRVLSQKNCGLTQSLIRGCAEARGEFIARQDADDISMPGRLAALCELMKSTDKIVMASSWCRYIGPEDEILYEIRRSDNPEKATSELLDERKGLAHGSVMFRRDVYEKVGGYRKEFYYGQDSDLWLRLAEKGIIAYAQSFLYAYRLDPETISFSNRDMQQQFGEIGQLCRAARQRGDSETDLLTQASRLTGQILSRPSKNGPRRGHRRRLADGNYFIGCGLLSRGDRRATMYFLHAIRAWPLHWRAWFRLVLSCCNAR